MNENLERLEYTFLHISIVFIVAGILISIFIKSYVSSEICNSWKRFLSGEYFSSYFKVIEIAAVIAAALTLYIEFGFQRPQEREVRNAQLLAQIADLSSGDEEKKATTSPAVKNIMQLLARENVPMEGISVQRMILKKAELENAILTEANLRKAKLSGSNLTGAELTDAELTDAELTDAELTDAELADAELVRADLTDADLISANLTKADLTSVNLTSAYLTDAVLADAVLRWSNLIYANFTDANLSNTELTGARLIDANLTDANLTDANLNGADLTGADLTGAYLVCAYLKETKFGNNQGLTQDMLDSALHFGAPKDNLPEGIEWKYAESNGNAKNNCKYLAGFNLSELDLTDANLTDANLTDANLNGADLTGADLTGADLTGADLTCAYLEETKFENNPGLTQDMLDSALPFGAPKDNLPGGLEWKYSGTQGNAQNKCKNLTGFDLKNADLTFSCLTAVNLTKADLTEANFYGATLDRAILVDANLLKTTGLTQDMLNSVAPSAPPVNLPGGLTWPFEENENGKWVPIVPAPASPN